MLLLLYEKKNYCLDHPNSLSTLLANLFLYLWFLVTEEFSGGGGVEYHIVEDFTFILFQLFYFYEEEIDV